MNYQYAPLLLLAAGLLAGCGGSGGGGNAGISPIPTATDFIPSPVGKYTVYIQNPDTRSSDLWLFNSRERDRRRVFDAAQGVSSPRWSQDRPHVVAFISFDTLDTPDEPSTDRIHLLNPENREVKLVFTEQGTSVRKILDIRKLEAGKITFAANGYSSDCSVSPCVDTTPLFEVNIDGTGLRQIAPE